MALLGCAGCSRIVATPRSLPPTAAALQAPAPADAAGPFLYVGGHKVAMFALGRSKPLHVTKTNDYSYGSGVALDLHGHLCVSTGNLSYQAIYEYDARTLKLEGETNLAGYFAAMVADRYGYLYASSVFGILVYAPGCTQRVNNLRHGGSALVFDRSGNLYASLGNAVGVYEPEQRRGHMRFVRRIRNGLRSFVSALAIGPSDNLFVADEIGQKGRYVVVYRPGSTQPARRVRVENPVAFAIDPSDNLYVLNNYRRSTVLVYSPGAAKLLRKITEDIGSSAALVIGSP